jgi:hypothetical protein
MASILASMIPSEVMNQFVVEKLNKQLVAGNAVARDYQSTSVKGGDSYKIPTISATAASNYTLNQTLTYGAIGATSVVLTIDQMKYFTYSVDKVDNKMAAVNAVNAIANQAAYSLAEAADTYLLQTVMAGGTTSAGSGTRALGISGTSISIVPTQAEVTGSLSAAVPVMKYLGRMAQRLDEADVPQSDRILIIPPWFQSYLVAAKILTTYNTTQDNAYDNGMVGRAYGFDIRVSTNLLRATAAADSQVIALHKSAVQFVDQVVDSEIKDLETMFGTGIRGLYIYGAKLVQPTAVAVGSVTQA